jgi:hypothetical protein
MIRSIARAILGLCILSAVATQYHESVVLHGAPADHFFSFFTIQSNIFAAATLLLVALAGRRHANRDAVVALRGAATLYLTITCVVYSAIPSWAPQILASWVNLTVHLVAPLALIVDWFSEPIILVGSYLRTIAIYLVYPAAFAVYSLVHGAITHWYPYYFLDPRTHGYLDAVAMALAILAFGALVGGGLLSYAPRHMALQRVKARRTNRRN